MLGRRNHVRRRPFGGETEQFEKHGRRRMICVSGFAEKQIRRPTDRRDFAERRDAGVAGFVEPLFDRRPTIGIGSIAAMCDDRANPIGKRHAGMSQRRRQIAEFQMRMRVHQSRQNRRAAEIDDISAAAPHRSRII